MIFSLSRVAALIKASLELRGDKGETTMSIVERQESNEIKRHREQIPQELKTVDYDPPKATFVPLTLGDRMSYCGKSAGDVGGGCFFGCK